MAYRTFQTERLLLRPTTLADAGFIFRLMNSPKWLRYIGDRGIRSEADARTYIRERMLPQLERLGYSSYTLVRKGDQCILGSCGLYDREGVEGLDIGFAFLPEYEGKGYGYEAASCLLNAAFETFGLNQVSAITAQDNAASQRLLEKLWLSRVGTVTLPGSTEVLLLYRIQKENRR